MVYDARIRGTVYEISASRLVYRMFSGEELVVANLFFLVPRWKSIATQRPKMAQCNALPTAREAIQTPRSHWRLEVYLSIHTWPYLMVVGLVLVFHCCRCCCRNCLPFSALAFNQPESHVLPINLSRVDKPKWHKECNGVYEGNLHSGNLT